MGSEMCIRDRGIKIGKEEFKFVQYADDLTVFVPNIENAQRIFNLLDRFKTCSGLQVNYKKTEAMWIGSCRNDTAALLGLTWVNTVKALGIVFTYIEIERLQENFYDKLKDIRLQIRLWRCRGLSLLGKITIIKSFLLFPFFFKNDICVFSFTNSARVYKTT